MVTIGILDKSRSEVECNVVYIGKTSFEKYHFMNINDSWKRVALLDKGIIENDNKEKLSKPAGEFLITRWTDTGTYGNAYAEVLIPNDYSLSTIKNQGSGVYKCGYIYETIKSCDVNSAAEQLITHDGAELDFSFHYHQFAIDKENYPSGFDNDLNEYTWEPSGRYISDTQTTLQWTDNNNNNQSQVVYPDKYQAACHVTVAKPISSAYISGPSSCAEGYTVHFYATAEGGFDPLYYQWWIKEIPESTVPQRTIGTRAAPPGVWVHLTGGIDNTHQSYKAKNDTDFYIKCVVTDGEGNSKESNVKFVDVQEDIPH